MTSWMLLMAKWGKEAFLSPVEKKMAYFKATGNWPKQINAPPVYMASFASGLPCVTSKHISFHSLIFWLRDSFFFFDNTNSCNILFYFIYLLLRAQIIFFIEM